jgi:hypothetical protein
MVFENRAQRCSEGEVKGAQRSLQLEELHNLLASYINIVG